MKILESSIPSGLTEITTSTLLTTLHYGEIASVELVQTCFKRAEQSKSVYVKKLLSDILVVTKVNISTPGLGYTAGTPAFSEYI